MTERSLFNVACKLIGLWLLFHAGSAFVWAFLASRFYSNYSVFDPDEDFGAISALLEHANISCCDFETTIDKAEIGDFVFCDPPYTTAHNMNGFVKYNQQIFSWDDQVRLRDAATRASERGATVIVTNADHPSLHTLYGGAGKIDIVERASVISGISKGRRMTSEMLVTG